MSSKPSQAINRADGSVACLYPLAMSVSRELLEEAKLIEIIDRCGLMVNEPQVSPESRPASMTCRFGRRS